MRNQFASFREKASTFDAQPLSAAYISGEHTYIEVFEAGKDPKFKLGMMGIGFNSEVAGESEIIRQRLNPKFTGKAKTDLSTLRNDNVAIVVSHKLRYLTVRRSHWNFCLGELYHRPPPVSSRVHKDKIIVPKGVRFGKIDILSESNF